MRRISALFFVLFACTSTFVTAAETLVPTGIGTLAQAVSNAADGDVLILENGSYQGDVLIDKSLTIRGTNSFAIVMITGASFVINKANIHVTLQGLDFGVTVTVKAAADVRILENAFYNAADVHVSDYKSTEGDGSLAVIGNTLASGGNIATIRSIDAYIAGNTLVGGVIASEVPVWIVGNEVIGLSNQNPVYVNAGVGGVQVLANRVTLNGTSGNTLYGIYVKSSAALISGNIVKLNNSGYVSRVRYGIHAPSSTFARVINNVVDGGNLQYYLNSDSRGILAYGEISGNIISNIRDLVSPIAGSGAESNLCFNNHNNGTCGNNALTIDPKFIDRTDYQLAADSPAIDTGSDSPFVADLDRTRNDMGAHGGPWAIDQYDAQRDPLYLAPFVYPLFDANASFIDGNLRVRALGVARLR